MTMDDEELSTIPSSAIRQAVKDVRACDSDPRYIIDMGRWHAPLSNGKGCLVCLAGAVIARKLGADVTIHKGPNDYRKEEDRLYGLDHFRNGSISEGLVSFGISIDKASEWDDRVMERATHRLLADLEIMADDLEEAGL